MLGGSQVDLSASGIDSLFYGVSIIVGKMHTTVDFSGISVLSAKFSTKEWVEDLDIAYAKA